MCKAAKTKKPITQSSVKTARSVETKEKSLDVSKPKSEELKKAAANTDEVNVETQTEMTDRTKTMGEGGGGEDWLGPKNFKKAAKSNVPDENAQVKLRIKEINGKKDEVNMTEESMRRQKLIDKKAAEVAGKEVNATTDLNAKLANHAPVTLNNNAALSNKGLNQSSTLPTKTPPQFVLRPSKERTHEKEPIPEKEHDKQLVPNHQQQAPEENHYEPILNVGAR